LETILKSYDRTAIICNITPEFKHENCAYERLTHTGPTAMLPFVQNRCGFVWTVQMDKSDEILALNDAEFLRQAQSQFGYRLGKFIKVGKRSSYPLYLVTVPVQVKARTILLGNAAHSMSPVSAQGLNLAVRDVAMLSDIIESALSNGIDIGSDEMLNIYQKSIETDQSQTMSYTDDLMNWFKIDQPVVTSLRSIGLIALDQSTNAKQILFSRVSGYRGNTPKLLKIGNQQ
ncbi:MAG: FAD-dependent monooxygenase, partial [Proteobacteria bacterium]|nr:FAD-dependent monooxygenase [Pseudomonadota bacterium]